uniref:Uncharacterized protein n=1 Tax=Moniliophthora roreri TaxID=221103 RepID=A0A0W0FE51_MONRR
MPENRVQSALLRRSAPLQRNADWNLHWLLSEIAYPIRPSHRPATQAMIGPGNQLQSLTSHAVVVVNTSFFDKLAGYRLQNQQENDC